MRIVVGLRPLFPGKVGGLETYIRELIKAWGETRREDEWIVLVNPETAPTFISPGPWMRFVTVGDAHDLTAWQMAAESHAPAVYFSPMLVIDPPDVVLPTVVNIPDVQHLLYPEFFDAATLGFRHLHFPLSARRAAAIVTLSAHARQSIIELLGARPEKVHDILLAAGVQFHPRPAVAGGDAEETEGAARVTAFLEKYKLPAGFGFFPANFWPHKNHKTLFAALAIYRRRHGDVPHIALSGFAGAGQEKIRAAIRAKKLEDRIHFLGYLAHDEVPVAYKAAKFLVFPSLFEGFGIPVAEAMASGCPVLASNATSIPEFAGDAALLFDPSNPGELADRLYELLSSPALRETLQRRGLERSRQLTWRTTADRTYTVLKDLHDRLADEPLPAVAAVPLDPLGRVDLARLPSVEPAPVLHFTSFGATADPAALAAAPEFFRGSGISLGIGAVQIAGTAEPAAPPLFSIGRLKSADLHPLESLWIGPAASRDILQWLRRCKRPPAGYEIALRAALAGTAVAAPALRVNGARPRPAPVSPWQGLRLSRLAFGELDDGWLNAWSRALIAQVPGLSKQRWALLAVNGFVRLWLTRKFPSEWRALHPWQLRPQPVPPTSDGWLGRAGILTVTRPSDGVLRLVLEAPDWPLPAPLQISIHAEGLCLYRGAMLRPGLYEMNWPWPAASERLTLLIRANAVYVPAEHGQGSDRRELSVRVH